MHSNLLERFGRSRKAYRDETGQAEIWALPQKLNPKIRQYFDEAEKTVDGGSWLDYPELPTSEEILSPLTNGSSSSDTSELRYNQIKGAWESKEAYLSTHYELLREDAIGGIKLAVQKVQKTPDASEDAFNGAIGIYDKVHICGVTCSTRGIAVKVTFSLGRAGKKIRWEQTRRLITGSLVILTPVTDKFKSRAIVATVAARTLSALEQNPPEIDLFIARAEEQEIDPAIEFVMVEDRGGLYEANRHTLLALQKMAREPFPLSEHLVQVQTCIDPPKYVEQAPRTDLSPVLTNNRQEPYENVDILRNWPSQPTSDLDISQLEALQRILTKRLAIIQGPPGTGKTWITVQAIRIMLANRRATDPPIIIACQTNHAIDQILRHIAQFETEFMRLGGRSKDRDVIKARTLYELRNQTADNKLHGSLAGSAKKRMSEIQKEFELLLHPLQPGELPMDFRTLQNLGLLSESQANSLESGASEWVQIRLSDPKQAQSPSVVWLGKELVHVPLKSEPDKFDFDFEEADLEFEQLKELEAENVAKDDEDCESLKGASYALADNFRCKRKNGQMDNYARIEEVLKEQDMWKIPERDRPAVYRYLQMKMKKVILAGFRRKTKEFNKQARRRRIGLWEKDETILKTQKIIGMTTTGLSKYRGLIAALEPKIVIIEEAAETLEAPVTVACLPSLQHLILVGDHEQLRPHCHVKEHEGNPHYLNVSLFERLVDNHVELSKLSMQRRMIPEIRRILHPIYEDLIQDHASVRDPVKRPNVPGMGGVNSFFFSHFWPELRDEQMSAYNPCEADMIVGFVEYLIYNGMQASDITVLTFYNGQRKRILKQLRERDTLTGQRFTVVTVDSYQGEENKVVLLSLVRSNEKRQIGFLNVANRVCVALSRAQCGFYVFGNGQLLYYNNDLWQKVIRIFANEGTKEDKLTVEPMGRIGDVLTVRCSNHDVETKIQDADGFSTIVGGCTAKCPGHLLCGHPCEYTCHPFSHDQITCHRPCVKQLSCGHECSALCGEACDCNICAKRRRAAQLTDADEGAEAFVGRETLLPASDSGAWRSFADAEPARYAAAIAAPPSDRSTPQQKESSPVLVELTVDEIAANTQQLAVGFNETNAGSQKSYATQLMEDKVLSNGARLKSKEMFVANAAGTGAESKKDWTNEASLLD